MRRQIVAFLFIIVWPMPGVNEANSRQQFLVSRAIAFLDVRARFSSSAVGFDAEIAISLLRREQCKVAIPRREIFSADLASFSIFQSAIYS